MIRAFEGHRPRIAAGAWVDETAVVIGDVTLGEDSSIWPLCVLRGDVNRIRIGACTNIQDGSVLHVTHEGPYTPGGRDLMVGDEVTVGHKVILHACTIHDRVMVGMGSIVMDGVVIESEVLLAAGSVVPPGKLLESGYLWRGSPARRVRPLTEEEKAHLRYSAEHYVRVKNRHAGGR
ncbi:gamma carbonic anhydrase family protein [Ectothiorhodospira lacustris]|uniref:gamma carbonic anhydrase family protein n=1 Tax=Ectothiorhodospira lacustris TaxID=2899127 RepID=UPI001EE9AA30|nr:gamma carbonic anhydrase family protein [Ectothiorhodospira lacustris]MCG5499750.1 gamma carbonic anhydrase family protein [Ectothiorhodospira lacustris]MCG5509793.1 gamma carbonic anhydrase family protein [Ectothiorhodospira lacustris]MCG5522293.1 gamma carbonic anhydrase family protein [Ectothiorhodospira lacustris]